MDTPKWEDWIRIKRIFKYLRGTSSYGIIYRKDSKQLKVYTDADYAGEIKGMHSTSGVIAMYSQGAISWLSQLQESVAVPTTEEEIVAASEGTKELIWLTRMLSELVGPAELEPTLYVNNASAVKLAKNPEFHKHIPVRHFFMREKVLK